MKMSFIQATIAGAKKFLPILLTALLIPAWLIIDAGAFAIKVTQPAANADDAEGVDLAVFPRDLRFSNTEPIEGETISIEITVYNQGNCTANGTVFFTDFYMENETLIDYRNVTIPAGGESTVRINWTPAAGDHMVYIRVNTTVQDINLGNNMVSGEIATRKPPDTSPEPFGLAFYIGLIALVLFFSVIILSLMGVIPQDRLPIQTALVVMTLIIVFLAFIGHFLDPQVPLTGGLDLSGMIIIHPITALCAGFLVAGALEAAGAFEAAADALNRLERIRIKGVQILGLTGTVTILVNMPTIIAMPCGRILGAALMPAALFFGYRVAKSLEDPRYVGVVVFPFIVNAAASCGPSPLGGIGTLGEGMTGMPIGAFTDAQQTGIIICTGVCALMMRFITPLIPAGMVEESSEEK